MRKGVVALVLIVLAAALGYGWYAKRQAAAAERQLGLDSTRVIAVAFERAKSLKVASINGKIVSTSTDPGYFEWLDNKQVTTVPFSVDYFVNLAGVGASNYQWNASTRTITIQVPDVEPAKPNVEWQNAVTTQDGVFISRGAGMRLQQAAAASTAARGEEEAKRTEHMAKARASALAAVAGMTTAPLQAAGLSGVRVVVRFPWDGTQGVQPMDRSRTVGEVMHDAPR